MCISTALAEFSGTTQFIGRVQHPVHGLIHVLGYQNTVVDLAGGPNAMLLHLPTRRMTRQNFIPVGRSADVLDRMVRAVTPVAAAADGIAFMGMGGPVPEVEVFEHDVYTVLLATDPSALHEALLRVEPRKRPRLSPLLLDFYAARYPEHAMVVCCFDNAEAARAKPLFLWYPPADADLLVLPALDCHTGEPPGLESDVRVDHWILFGTDEAPGNWGEPVAYDRGMRHTFRAFLPDNVLGTYVDGTLPNGDFAIDHADLLTGDLERIRRLRPTA